MKPRSYAAVGRGVAGRGFTLIELLVVVVIIAILIGILVPAVGAVRRSARETASRAILGTLGTGLEMFKADGRVGGGYPPSFSDSDGTSMIPIGEVANPYAASPTSIPITGAGLLVWALVGADQLGTPGFKVFRTDPGCPGYNQARVWSADTDAGNYGDNPACSGAYALRADDRRPIQPRSGPFIESSKIQLSEWTEDPDTGDSGFVIPAEREANPANMLRPYPMFLDAFGFPILYWKADAAGVQLVDYQWNDPDASGTSRGIYHFRDNGHLLENLPGDKPLILRPGAEPSLSWDTAWTPTAYDPDNPPPLGTFPRYIMNPDIRAKLAPHRADSYLLVTPGADGVYGTGDDIANFEHNGR